MSHPLAALVTAEAVVRSTSGHRHGPAATQRESEARAARARPWWSLRGRRRSVLTRRPAAG
jgi:hypothetical protein